MSPTIKPGLTVAPVVSKTDTTAAALPPLVEELVEAGERLAGLVRNHIDDTHLGKVDATRRWIEAVRMVREPTPPPATSR